MATIVICGGGSGGHITPSLAVARELKKLQPDCRLVYVIERRSKFMQLVTSEPAIDEVRAIFAGKFRRYHGDSFLRRLSDIRSNARNLRDVLYVGFGFLQALGLIVRLKPNSIFIKGGYVGLPVGVVGALCRCPMVTHDSDTVPGLTNRIIGKWAKVHATGMPTTYYNYPKEKTIYTGIPLAESYQLVTDEIQKKYKKNLGLPIDQSILLVAGGSLGARALNKAVAAISQDLLTRYPSLHIFHQVGKGNDFIYSGRLKGEKRLNIYEFINDMYRYSGAADVIITRAGATTMAEFAAQAKACIIVPHPGLTGGHQVDNATYYEKNEAAIVVAEQTLERDPRALLDHVEQLLNERHMRRKLSGNLHQLIPANASRDVAQIVLKSINQPPQ